MDVVARGIAGRAASSTQDLSAALGQEENRFNPDRQFNFQKPPRALSSGGGPIELRSSSDGLLDGIWNGVHNGSAGNIFHFTTGVDTALARNIDDLETQAGSTTIRSAKAQFVNAPGNNGDAGDLGKIVSADALAAGTRIAAIVDPQTAIVTKPARTTVTGQTARIGTGNPNGAIIAMGVDNGATGLVVRNKQDGVGINIQQMASVRRPSSYALYGYQASSVAPFARFDFLEGATKPLFQLTKPESMSIASGANWFEIFDNTGRAGVIAADTGQIKWQRKIESSAASSTKGGHISATSSLAYDVSASDVDLVATDGGETGLRFRRFSGSNGLFFATRIAAESDRLKFQVGNGPKAKGDHSYRTAMEMRTIGSGDPLLAFFGASPVGQPRATAPAATDLTSAIALVNDLRAKLLSLGLIG